MEYRRDLEGPLAVTGYAVDRLGSISNLTDAVGEARDAYRFDAFGTEAMAAGLDDNPFRFSGSSGTAHEPAVPGLVRMGFRYYDAEVGRFISRDPIGFFGGDVNLYAYVANNPATFVDLNGLSRGNPLAHGLRVLQWLGEDYHWLTVPEVGGTVAFVAGVAIVTGGTATPLMLGVGGGLMSGGFAVGTSAYAFDVFGVKARAVKEGNRWALAQGAVTLCTAPFAFTGTPLGQSIGLAGTAFDYLDECWDFVSGAPNPEE